MNAYNSITPETIQEDMRYLQLLSHSFPTIADASTEIINLEAILNLPKGTEHFLTDIHGEYDKFKEVLKQINLQKEDLLYVLGDVVDRGPHPMEILLKMMEMPNVIPIAGNHELMALKCLRFLNQEITDESIDDLEKEMLEKVNKLGIGPQGFGGKTTAIGLNIETMPTHIAGMPCAVNINCHVTRHKTEVI